MLLVALSWEEGDVSSSSFKLKRGQRIKLHTSRVRDVTNAPSNIRRRREINIIANASSSSLSE